MSSCSTGFDKNRRHWMKFHHRTLIQVMTWIPYVCPFQEQGLRADEKSCLEVLIQKTLVDTEEESQKKRLAKVLSSRRPLLCCDLSMYLVSALIILPHSTWTCTWMHLRLCLLARFVQCVLVSISSSSSSLFNKRQKDDADPGAYLDQLLLFLDCFRDGLETDTGGPVVVIVGRRRRRQVRRVVLPVE